MMKLLFRLVVLLPIFLFFLATAPGNRSDADMAFEYARRVEEGVGRSDPHFPLYLPLMRGLYLPLRRIGVVDRAYPLMTVAGAAFAAATVYLFFLFCYHRFSLRPLSSLFAAGFFLFSHGVWRYAAEAEPMVPAGCLALGAFFLLSRPDPTRRDAAIGGLIAGLAVALHYLSLVPVLVMIPLYLALTGRARRLTIYLAAVFAMVSTVVLAITLSTGFAFRPFWHAYDVPRVSIARLVLRAMVGLGQSMVAGNALPWFAPVRELLTDLFPFRMLEEEFFQAQRLSAVHAVTALLTLCATVFFFLYGGIRAWRVSRSPDRRQRTVPGGRAALAGVSFWFLAHAALTLGNQPGKPESWMMAMAPLWLLFCGVFIAPLARANKLWIVLALLMAFGMHNGIGGMAVVRDPAGDYNAVKAAWLIERAGPDDVVVTADTQVFVRYLRYHVPARVVDLNAAAADVTDTLRDAAGRVYVFGDVLDPPVSLGIRFPESSARARERARELSPGLSRLEDNAFGGVFLWEPQDR